MSKRIFGISGCTQSGKSAVSRFFAKKGAKWIDFHDLLNDLFLPGNEGHRQIVNFFGDEFLLKSGKLNTRKLWKFVYSDIHKLRILDFLLQPLLINQCQKIIDSSDENLYIIEQLSFADLNWNNLLEIKFWVERHSAKREMNKLTEFMLPMDKIIEAQKGLYAKVKSESILLTNKSTISQLEKQLIGYV